MKNLLFFTFIILLAGCARDHKSDAYGNFEATEIVVSSEANGRILELEVEEGLMLNKGYIVGLIDTTDLFLKRLQLIKQKQAVGTRIKTIESQIRVQEQQLKNLMVEKKRVDKLYADGAATRKQVDDIDGGLQLIKEQIAATRIQKVSVVAEVETIGIQILQTDEALAKCTIKNPVKGTILAKYASAGEVTTFGRPLYKIADLEEMKLKVFISGDQLPHISIGQQVEVLIDEDAKNNRKLEGTVSWISQKAEFTPKTIQTKTERVNLVYAVKVKVKNDGSRKIGMPGESNFLPDVDN